MTSVAAEHRLKLARHLTAEHGLFSFRLRNVHAVHSREHRQGAAHGHDHDRQGRGLRLPSFAVK
jgi:hypothetical protein